MVQGTGPTDRDKSPVGTAIKHILQGCW